MGGVVAYRLRADLRRRWRTMVGIGLLVAALGGIVLAAAAGARRTSSAYDRLLDLIDPPELLVSPPGGGPGFDPSAFYDAVAQVPGVRSMQLGAGIPLVPEAGTPSVRLSEVLSGIGVIAPIDGSSDASIGRARLIAGRLPEPVRADEILVTERFAAVGDLAVGDHIDAVLLTQEETDVVVVASADQGQPIRLTVTGIGVAYDEVVPFNELNESGSIIATAPLADMVDRSDWNFEGAWIDAEPGTDLAGLTEAIETLGLREELGTGGPVFVSDEASQTRQVSDSMRPLAVALAVAAVAIGLVALLVVGQAVSRASREAPGEVDALRAIGSRPDDRAAFTIARTAIVGVVGAAGAVVIALALSNRFPIGVARIAEPDPGLRADQAVLAVGAVMIAMLTIVSALPAALLGVRRSVRRTPVSRLAGAAAASGLSPAAAQGVRFATLGGGSHPVPLRSTLVAVTAAITSVLATITFGASLVGLIDTPSRYGQGWDRMVDAQFGPAPVTRVIERFAETPEVRGIAVGNYGNATVNGLPVPAFDLQSVRGDVSVSIVDGRPAIARNEIVLGTESLDRLDVGVGDTVDVDTGAGRTPMLVTGRGVFPRMGQGSFSTTGLGIGAQLGGRSFDSFGDFQNLPPDYELDGNTYTFVALDVDGSPSSLDAGLTELEAATAADGAFAFVRHEQAPTKIRDLARVRVVPAAMACVLALVAVAALAHLLVTSVRERPRELALLRTLGFSQGQLRATVGWHASVIALTALIVGTPAGIIVGRVVWRWFAGGLNASAPAETPWLWLLVALVATVVVANVVAAVPRRSAGRTRPAIILREE